MPTAADSARGSARAIDILCYEPNPDTSTSGDYGCARVATLFADVTIVRSVDDFPTTLSSFDVIVISTDETTLLDSYASQLNEFVDNGGGLIVSQPTFTTGTQPFPPGFEITVSNQFWPGFPLTEIPAVEFTSVGSAHPILAGLTPAALAGNVQTVPNSTLGTAWSVLAQSTDDPHAALAVGAHGSGRLIIISAAGSPDATGDQWVRQMIEWAAQEDASATTPTPLPTPTFVLTSTPSPTPSPMPTPAGPDMQIEAIEVTQAVQDLNNSVDLIANKRTFVRVYISASGLGSASVANVVANLGGMRDGVPIRTTLIPGNPGADIMLNSAPDRGQLNDSFWFELPAEWIGAGELTLTATVDPNNTKSDPDLANNVKDLTVNFLEAPPLPLRLYNVQYRVDGVTYKASNFHMDKAESWLRRAYPISELDVKRTNLIYPEEGLPESNRLFSLLGIARRLSILLSVDSSDRLHYGLVDNGGGTMPAGLAKGIPGHLALGPTGPTGPEAPLLTQWDRDGSFGDWVMGHEIGHLVGRSHADFCGVGEDNSVAPYPHRLGRISPTTQGDRAIYGFDIESMKIYGPNWKDIMTYCDYKWVSDFTYEGIRTDMAGAASAASVPTIQAEKFLIVSGIVPNMANVSNPIIELLNVQLIEQESTVPLPQSGDWSIVLLDSTNNAVATYPFAPQRLVDAEDRADSPALISEAVPWVEGTVAVEIRADDQTVATKIASANAPAVTIDTPTQDQVFGDGPIQFEWTGSDADQDPLTYSVLYRHAGASGWTVLSTNLVTPTLTVDASLLPGGSMSELQIIASDGFLTGVETVGPFTVPAGKPEIAIESPLEDGAVFYPGQLITLQGSGYDLEDEQLEDGAFSWSSDVDGVLGVGVTVQSTALSTGTHQITLTATDSDGAIGQARRTISILADSEAVPDVLSIAPSLHSVVASVNQAADFSTTFTIRNNGDAPLNWTASKDAAWISLSETSGVSPSGLTVTVDSTGLALGMHQATVTIEAAEATNSPVVVPVIVEVVEEGAEVGTSEVYLPLLLK